MDLRIPQQLAMQPPNLCVQTLEQIHSREHVHEAWNAVLLTFVQVRFIHVRH